MKTNQPQFVEFKTKDGLTLPGLLYRGEKDKAVVIYLHGNGIALSKQNVTFGNGIFG